MRTRRSQLALASLLGTFFAFSPAIGMAQRDQDVEVLARGPVHEAFATTAEAPVAGGLVPKIPPAPVEELPPDQKPAGDNVQWIPGYWHFDEERTDYIWISGFWRVPPPGRVWLPGSWREMRGGWQWVHGFWQQPEPEQAELEYLPPPPVALETAPSIPMPTQTSFYVPGSWVWRNHYVWRPGCWVEHRTNWVWVPAHYCWTPGGYIFIDGYWDHPIAGRGVLFAPVVFTPAVIARPTYVYTPSYAISSDCMMGALFTRRGWSSYYFGDYFEPRYTTIGYNAWCGSARGTNFAVSVGFGRTTNYDPLWSYYQVANRSDPTFVTNINSIYVGRFNGQVQRPPRTLVTQNTVVNNITNVTNVTNNVTNVTNTVNNKTVNNNVANSLLMVQPLKTIQQTNTNIVLKPVLRDEQVSEQKMARQLRDVGVQRDKAETKLVVNRQSDPVAATDKPRQIKLDVPKNVVARAQAPATPEKAPPPPAPTQLSERKNRTPNAIPPATDPTKPVNPLAPPAAKDTPKPAPGINPMVIPPAKPVMPPKVDPKPQAPGTTPPAPTPGTKPTPPVIVPPPLPGAKPVQPMTPPIPGTNPAQPVTPTPPIPPGAPPKVDPKPQAPGQPLTVPVPMPGAKPVQEVKPPTPSPLPAPMPVKEGKLPMPLPPVPQQPKIGVPPVQIPPILPVANRDVKSPPPAPQPLPPPPRPGVGVPQLPPAPVKEPAPPPKSDKPVKSDKKEDKKP